MKQWQKTIITPQKLHDDIIKLCKMIPKNNFNFVFGIPRGGLVISVYVSHYCGLEIVSEGEIFHLPNPSKVLIVDDIVDTGKTWDEQYSNDGFETLAVLYYKPRAICVPTYYVEEVSNDEWVVYPWEKNDEEPNREM